MCQRPRCLCPFERDCVARRRARPGCGLHPSLPRELGWPRLPHHPSHASSPYMYSSTTWVTAAECRAAAAVTPTPAYRAARVSKTSSPWLSGGTAATDRTARNVSTARHPRRAHRVRRCRVSDIGACGVLAGALVAVVWRGLDHRQRSTSLHRPGDGGSVQVVVVIRHEPGPGRRPQLCPCRAAACLPHGIHDVL
jgi:hypothetical protein